MCDIRLILIALCLPHIRRVPAGLTRQPAPDGRVGERAYVLTPGREQPAGTYTRAVECDAVSDAPIGRVTTVGTVRVERTKYHPAQPALWASFAEPTMPADTGVSFRPMPEHRVTYQPLDGRWTEADLDADLTKARERMAAREAREQPTGDARPLQDSAPVERAPSTDRNVARDVAIAHAARKARGEERRVRRPKSRRTFVVKVRPTHVRVQKAAKPRGFGLASFVGATRFGPVAPWIARLNAIAKSSK